MTPTFINTNSHYVYVDLPGRDEDLTRVRAFEKIKVSGADADALEQTNGVVNIDTADDDQLAAIDTQLKARDLAGLNDEVSSGDPDDAAAVKQGGEAAANDPGKGGGGTVTTSDVKAGGSPKKAASKKAPAKKTAAPKKAEKLPDPPPQVGKGSGTAEWAKFAKKIGLDVADDAKKADLVKQVNAELAKRSKES